MWKGKRDMSWVTSFLRWRHSRRQSRRIALVAEVANVVVQQHWQPWQLPTCCCSHCKLPIFHIGNFCPWCGTCFLAPEKPVAARSSPASYEIPDRHTSGYSLPVAPRNPKRTQVLGRTWLRLRRTRTNCLPYRQSCVILLRKESTSMQLWTR